MKVALLGRRSGVMHLPRAMMEHLRAGLGAAALITTVAPAAGCATAQGDRPQAQAPFAGMGARANPPAPIPVVRPIARPVATPAPVVRPVAPPVEPAPPPPKTWECGPCGMG